MSQNDLTGFSEAELIEFQQQVKNEIEARNSKIKEFLGTTELVKSWARDDGKFGVELVVDYKVLGKLKRIL